MACGGCGSVEPYALYEQFSALAYKHINSGLTPDKYILLDWYQFRDYCLKLGWKNGLKVLMADNGEISLVEN